ncbi:hypothetical protein CONLIGDRAFT_646999 [Coniochaeta ligniaria NRRL 30616]|uniref:3'-5' exonuclease domain-containing protein n=1 Tax=Coniochaeta ligniaria NRRL 30616 TaxID=1408157 RepID=A0A1J7J0L7_9PEZI|nr:hypothetical protein CONLIGDRAFT_646999 [Coniochaeta ligniaria NRRL 30616]
MATTTPAATLISSLPGLMIFLSSIPTSSTLYLDLEGRNLSRNGTLAVMTVLVHPTRVTGIIDIQALGNSAFTTPGGNGKTLKAILEDPNTPKCLWDVRNDADALWTHYKVRLAGVTDIQLLENASRDGDKTYVRGLDTCVQRDLSLGFMERNRWIRTKEEVQALMPNDIFSRWPLDAKTMQYCVNDVVHLPALHDAYAKRIDSQWMQKVMDESARRVADACSPVYEPQSEKKKLGPWGTGLDKKELTMDEWLEECADRRMDEEQREWLGYDDWDEYDDDPISSRDAAWDDTFDSCWEK